MLPGSITNVLVKFDPIKLQHQEIIFQYALGVASMIFGYIYFCYIKNYNVTSTHENIQVIQCFAISTCYLSPASSHPGVYTYNWVLGN